ncbi:MAG: LytTR family transcriptional regulator DNA-binding domain-containing protein [Clostridiales bacterium]|jgi:DNA-binding LytR/AlgR family response regulator|nr:LytTR family transcriptional regulator DNA-binding domain-containing protein [Clostridiales bacterium]
MYRIAIADDNELHMAKLCSVVRNCLSLGSEGNTANPYLFHTPEEILRYIENTGFAFDIIILDIHFSGSKHNGISIAEHVNFICPSCEIIYVSGNINLIKDIYKTEHTYFVLKSEVNEKIPLAIDKAVKNIEKNRGKSLLLPVKEKMYVVNTNEILYLDHSNRITTVVLANKKIPVYESIEKLLLKINSDLFVHCHKSYAVNLSSVLDYKTKTHFTVQDEITIPISRSFAQTAHARFMKFMGEI